MNMIINFCKKVDIPLDEGHEACAEIVQRIGINDAAGKLSPDVVEAIKALWETDSGIQKALTRRNEFQLNDQAEYFFNHILRVAADDYLPDDQDMLRARVRTTGIVEAEFDVDGYHFRC